MIELKADELMLKVPHTSEGIVVAKAMVNLLEAMLTEEEKEHEEEGDLKTGRFAATGNLADLLHLHEGETQAVPAASFSPVISSPKQRIKFKGWEALAKSRAGTIYKEVVNRILEEYKDDVEPSIKTISQIIQEMYGNHLKAGSIASYVSVYKRYIRDVIGGVDISKEVVNAKAKRLAEAHSEKYYKKGVKELLPIEKVCEIWNLLPSEFTYKQVKALIPAGTMQSGARISTTNYTLREFKGNPMFECEETSPGIFKKSKSE